MRLSLIASVLGVVAGASAANAANLVTNGGFESGLTGWTLENVVDPTADFGLDPNALSGTRSVRFGHAAVTSATTLSQDLPLVAGQSYELSFWVYNLGIDGDRLSVDVSNAPNTLSQTLIAPDFVGTGLESWTQVVVPFVASDNWARLGFHGYDNTAAFYIDDISLTAVPAPASVGLLALGLIPTARRRRV